MFSSLLALALTLAPVRADAGAASSGSAAAAVGDATPAPVYRHLGDNPPAHGYPEIRTLHLSTTEVRPGHAVSAEVTTSDNVGYVEARVNNFNAAFHRDGPGQFSLTYTVPWWLPPWLRKPYALQFIARSVDGVETVREVAIFVR
jgi:hypothetical protein